LKLEYLGADESSIGIDGSTINMIVTVIVLEEALVDNVLGSQ